MLFKLAFKNIRKSIKDYAIYFLTLLIGVIIFYVFNAIETQTAMMNVQKSTYDIIQLMNSFLSGVSVFVAIVLGALIVYASNFLIKRRNKEFGIYLTLGMSKGRMSAILFVETLLVGVISLILGLGLGVVLSQFMSIVVSNIFEADMTGFRFVFSMAAAVKTCIYFGIMYLVSMLFNAISISRCKLIDLLHANKKSEKLKLRNPILCLIIFIAAWVILGVCYYLVNVKINEISPRKDMPIIIVAGCIATFLVFWSISGSILTVARAMKKLYYRKLNSFTFRQFSSKANTMVISMSLICLMLFLTITMLGSSISLSRSMNKNIRELAPCDAIFVKPLGITGSLYGGDNPYADALKEDAKKPIIQSLNEGGVDCSLFDETTTAFYYDCLGLNMDKTLGENLKPALGMYMFIAPDSFEGIMTESDYNKVAHVFGAEEVTLGKNEYAMVANLEIMIKIRSEVMESGRELEYNGFTLKPAYDRCLEGSVFMSETRSNEGVIVVPDEAVSGVNKTKEILYVDYAAMSRQELLDYDEKIVEQMNSIHYISTTTSVDTREGLKRDSVGLGATLTFISLYIGIVFLIASAAIISLKEVSESTDNIERFAVLRRIGTDEHMIDMALFKQIGMFFLFPITVAAIHSVFGLNMVKKIFESFGMGSLGIPLLITAIIIVAVYGGYFLLTYATGRRIIKG
jgi:putative ABC transport system permease protein